MSMATRLSACIASNASTCSQACYAEAYIVEQNWESIMSTSHWWQAHHHKT